MNRKSFKNRLFFANGTAALALLLAAVMLSLSLVGCAAVDPDGGYTYYFNSYDEYLSLGKTTPLLDNIDERGYTWRKGDGTYHKEFSDKPDPNECYWVSAALNSKTSDCSVEVSCRYNRVTELHFRLRLLETLTRDNLGEAGRYETHPENIRQIDVNGITVYYCLDGERTYSLNRQVYAAIFTAGGYEYSINVLRADNELQAREIITEFVSRAA